MPFFPTGAARAAKLEAVIGKDRVLLNQGMPNKYIYKRWGSYSNLAPQTPYSLLPTPYSLLPSY
ncbi:hypothetical protein [Moorena sp. SIO3H5]|uniref:hypothetical protein n=1 Tax=Moorena sp. SIO3H5 TaxID=2607834 RepID=UPI0013B5DF49|nr:hypothetical protein [Moorena sp. SIO3H5]NEO68832.1 hypothetical protein [Moorena sp. SIO3H5]